MSESETTEDLLQPLADAFSHIVRDTLNRDEISEVLRGNRAPLARGCTTVPSGNAGALLVRAFVEIIGRVPDADGGRDLALWNAAWALARNARFPRRLERCRDAEGHLAYAFSIRGSCIVDPRRSEDFFDAVDPESYYGLRAEELPAFDHANSMLQGDAASIATADGSDRTITAFTLGSTNMGHPHVEVWHTGEGGHALRIDCAGGGYLLITECDNAQVPPPTATEVDVGRFAANGDEVESESALPVTSLLAWIDQAMARARHPQNLRDYFVLKLGADPRDATLIDLPLESPSGQDCAKAIDGTAELRRHLRAAFGECLTEERLVELARRLVGVFWRG